MRHMLWLACWWFVAGSAGAQVDVAALRTFVEGERKAQEVPGLSIALVVEDQLVWSEGFGFADLESGLLATGGTVYRIGSVSKPIVATGLMQLVEQGKVDLDADVRKYVPQWPEKQWTITVRHLLTHTSGIRHYRGQEFLSKKSYDDLVAPLDIFKDDPLLFEPGTKFSYTTYGFNMVANIVENVSGQPIETYMREHVFRPAWMNDTGLESWSRLRKHRARWYSRNGDGELENAPYVDLSNKYAGGGLTSTVEDLARLHIAYARGKLLRSETIEQMFTPQTLADGTPHGYGLGWASRRVQLPGSETTARRISHSGGSVGATTLYWSFPDLGLALAIVTNIESDRAQILNGVLERVLRSGAPLTSDR